MQYKSIGCCAYSELATRSRCLAVIYTETNIIIIIIIIIIITYCNWVVTRWQWLFYMHTKYEIGY